MRVLTQIRPIPHSRELSVSWAIIIEITQATMGNLRVR